MEEIGIVRRIDGPRAFVVVERKSACDSCRAGCKVTDGGAEIEAINEAKAAVGQTVRVAMKPYLYLKGSLLVYGLPALSLILGAIAGKEYLSGSFPGVEPDIISAVTGFGAFLLSFVIVKLWSGKAEKKAAYQPVIVDILK